MSDDLKAKIEAALLQSHIRFFGKPAVRQVLAALSPVIDAELSALEADCRRHRDDFARERDKVVELRASLAQSEKRETKDRADVTVLVLENKELKSELSAASGVIS